MQAVRSNNLPVLLSATAFFVVCGATMLLQRSAISKQEEQRPPADSSATLAQTGKSTVGDSVTACQIELENGKIDCRPAAAGESRVSWEIVERAGVDAQLMEVQVTQDDGVLQIEDKWHGKPWGNKPEVHVKVWLPLATDLELALGNGKIATALNGKLKAAIGNGDLRLEGAPSALEVAVGNGKVHGTAKLAQGDNAVHLGNGDIELQLVAGSDAKVEANTATGKVLANGLAGQVTTRDWVGSSFAGQIGGGAAEVLLEVGHGNVQVAGPEQK